MFCIHIVIKVILSQLLEIKVIFYHLKREYCCGNFDVNSYYLSCGFRTILFTVQFGYQLKGLNLEAYFLVLRYKWQHFD